MGISADIILFGEDGDCDLDDFESSETLYEFLPVSLHHLIYEQDIEIYDMHSYRELFGEDVRIIAQFPNGAIELSDGTHISEPLTTFARCNYIKYKSLFYIGGKESFVDIFAQYNKRKSFPYLWSYIEWQKILKTQELKYWKQKVEEFEKHFLYINLNY